MSEPVYLASSPSGSLEDVTYPSYPTKAPMVTIHEVSRAPSVSNDENAGSKAGQAAVPDKGRVESHGSPRRRGIISSAELDSSAVNPFNFETVQYSTDSPIKSELGRRKGHRYRHSSVSQQPILDVEPAIKSPLLIPASIPLPTIAECWTSTNTDQRMRALWCFCHLGVAASIQWLGHAISHSRHSIHSRLNGEGSVLLPMSLIALSHLLFFDVFGAFLCVAVDIGSNFEVWNKSSVSNPFGLRRLELLSSLSMGVGLLFMGFDLVSHTLAHSIESHHHHHHTDEESPLESGSIVPPVFSLSMAALGAIGATLISASVLGNHARIGKALRASGGVLSPHSGSRLGRVIASLPGLLSNPSHLLTISCAGILFIFSLSGITLQSRYETILDNGISTAAAACMVSLGGRLCVTLGQILLMSFPITPPAPKVQVGDKGASPSRLPVAQSHIVDVLREIRSDPAVADVTDSRFWQVHYELAMANIRLSMPKHKSSEITKLRERIGTLIRNRLSSGYGDGTLGLGKGFRWEVSVEVELL